MFKKHNFLLLTAIIEMVIPAMSSSLPKFWGSKLFINIQIAVTASQSGDCWVGQT
jgi:hypothetical protein